MVRGSLSDASAVSVHRYGLTELSSGVTGEDDVPLVKYAPQSQDGVDISDLVSIIVVHGLCGHPKRTWEENISYLHNSPAYRAKKQVIDRTVP